MTAGSVMNGAPLDRQQVEIDVVTREDDLLRRPTAHGFGSRVGDRLQLLQALHLRHEPFGRLHLEHVAEALRDLVQRRRTEREAHAPLGAELVDQKRMRRAFDVLEQQRRPARLDDAIVDLRDLEVCVDLGGDANELALALEQRDPRAQIAGRGHRVHPTHRTLPLPRGRR